jgi:hypothetical protein
MRHPQIFINTWGKIFVGIGSNEISNKMASYTTDREVFIIKTSYISGCSSVAADRQYHREFSNRVAPSTDTPSTELLYSLKKKEMCD